MWLKHCTEEAYLNRWEKCQLKNKNNCQKNKLMFVFNLAANATQQQVLQREQHFSRGGLFESEQAIALDFHTVDMRLHSS